MKHVAVCAECGEGWPCAASTVVSEMTIADVGPTASQIGRLGARVSWANTKDRAARTAPARAALDAKFLAEADGDPVRAEHIRKAYYGRLALKSAATRRAKAALRKRAQAE